MKHKDVHTEHCCKIHGCKYGEDDSCTVTNGPDQSKYSCEQCGQEKEEAISQKEFEKLLEEVITGLTKQAESERHQKEPYKALFKASEGGLKSLLSKAEGDMLRITLDLADVIRAKFGIQKVSGKLWKLLKALPLAMYDIRDNIAEAEGNCCCADKARYVYYLEVFEEINRIKMAEINT